MNFIGMIEERYEHPDLAGFIAAQEEGFFKNITTVDYTTEEGKSIRKGTKLVKAFKYFINNERSLTDIQNEASRIIQEDKIEGTLCVSIHPLDFLSISETTHNWRSCHALDGEYRAGNLSYMMDKCTFICYLKSDSSTTLPNFPNDVPWNSKKWRVLMYLSEDGKMLIAGRQYPFSSPSGIDFVLKTLLPESGIIPHSDIRTEVWSDWNDKLIENVDLSNHIKSHFGFPYIPIGYGLLPLNEVVKDGDGAKQFNDVLRSSFYKPIYAFKYLQPWYSSYGGTPATSMEETKFSIGGYTYCLWCGENECLEGADTMMCADCELEHGNSDSDIFAYCPSCGHRYIYDEGYDVNGEDSVCPDCYEKYCTTCEKCGMTVYNEDIKYYEEDNAYLCRHCYERVKEDY